MAVISFIVQAPGASVMMKKKTFTPGLQVLTLKLFSFLIQALAK
jgi:hypothetical protein